MPTLDFKGKQIVYAHHLTIPYRPLVPDYAKSKLEHMSRERERERGTGVLIPFCPTGTS